MIYLISTFITLGVIGSMDFTTELPPNNDIIKLQSNIDHRTYTVQDMEGKEKATDLMAQIRVNIDKLVEQSKQTILKSKEKFYLKYWTNLIRNKL